MCKMSFFLWNSVYWNVWQETLSKELGLQEVRAAALSRYFLSFLVLFYYRGYYY